MSNVSWKWLAVVGLVVLLFVTGRASVSVGGTNAATGEPVVVETPPVSAGEEDLNKTTDGLLSTVPQLLSAMALGGFVALVLNVAKLFPGAGKLDGQTGTISIVVNIVAFVAITVAGYFGYGDRVKAILEQTGSAIPSFLGIFTLVGGLLSQMGGATLVHKLMKKINGLAFSLSTKNALARQATKQAVVGLGG